MLRVAWCIAWNISSTNRNTQMCPKSLSFLRAYFYLFDTLPQHERASRVVKSSLHMLSHRCTMHDAHNAFVSNNPQRIRRRNGNTITPVEGLPLDCVVAPFSVFLQQQKTHTHTHTRQYHTYKHTHTHIQLHPLDKRSVSVRARLICV